MATFIDLNHSLHLDPTFIDLNRSLHLDSIWVSCLRCQQKLNMLWK